MKPTFPWWLEEAVASRMDTATCSPLVGKETVDVVIVGGGYTGFWTALALTQKAPRLSVIVLEAETCGSGPSGRNGGIMFGYWSMLSKLIDLLGDRQAFDIAQAGSHAQAAVTAFCASCDEDLWFERGGFTLSATSSAQLKAVERSLRQAAVIPEQYRPRRMCREQLSRRYNTDSLLAGAWFPEGATLHPARLLHALKRAVLKAGVTVYESSRVVGLDSDRDLVVRTGLGEVHCRDVVLATGSWLADKRPFNRHLTNLGSYMVVTRPLPEILNAMDGGRGIALSDGRMFLNWVRATPDGRLIGGTGAGPMSYGGRVTGIHTQDTSSANRAARALLHFFPAVNMADIVRAWGGPIDMSSDHLPFFGTRPKSRVHYAVGYSGHGVSTSWIGGQVLSSLVLNQTNRWTRSPFACRKLPRLPPEPFRYLGGRAIHASTLAVEDALDEGKRPGALARLVASAPRRLGLKIGTR